MTNFRALNTLTIYSNISKIRLLIRVTHCRNTRIQMDLSKSNHFSAKEARKKGTSMWNAWVLWVFVFPHASNSILETEDNSLRRQHCIVTKSSIIDDLGSETCLWYVCFVRKTLPTRFKHNKVDIYMFKVKM